AVSGHATLQAGARKNSSARAVGGQRGDHALRAARGWRLGLVRTLAAGNAGQECHLLLSHLYGEGGMAVAAGGVLSPSRRLARALESAGRGGGAGCGHGVVLAFPRTPLSAGRLVLVSGNAGPDDRNRSGRAPSVGGPLRVSSSLGIVRDWRLAGF